MQFFQNISTRCGAGMHMIRRKDSKEVEGKLKISVPSPSENGAKRRNRLFSRRRPPRRRVRCLLLERGSGGPSGGGGKRHGNISSRIPSLPALLAAAVFKYSSPVVLRSAGFGAYLFLRRILSQGRSAPLSLFARQRKRTSPFLTFWYSVLLAPSSCFLTGIVSRVQSRETRLHLSYSNPD